MPTNARPALFLDRDGVLNEEVNYLHDPRELVLIHGVGRVIADFNRLGIPVVVVTNQAGIGRGYYNVAAYESVNRAINEHLKKEGATIDAWYFCPHAPDSGCHCRKPQPGMILQAIADLGIDACKSILVGDKISDLEAATAAHIDGMLVRTGHGREEERVVRETQVLLSIPVMDSLEGAHSALRRYFGYPIVDHRDP
jgi:D-glycero-D-manno-heptose 1,7-bisphosphate phosphatase